MKTALLWTLGTYQHNDTITRINFIWSCPLLWQFMLTATIFDAYDMHISDHNPVITFWCFFIIRYHQTCSCSSIWPQYKTCIQIWLDLSCSMDWICWWLDALCSAEQFVFDSWHLNQKCEYLHSHIIKAAKAKLPSVTVGNTYTPKKPKDLEYLIQSYHFLSKVAKTIRLLHKTLCCIHHISILFYPYIGLCLLHL